MQTQEALLYLTACGIQNKAPDKAKLAGTDMQALLQVSRFHSLSALVCTALEASGAAMPDDFRQDKAKAIRKNLLLDAERSRICSFLEEHGIWYMPLKGVILKELYPGVGLRQMADNDILFDAAFQREVLAFMQASGYTPESVGKCHHDTYLKEPIYNFELHTMLFDQKSEFYSYYADVKERLVQDAGKAYSYHFTDEDFFIFFLAHAYKHASAAGTGLRTLLDCYVFLKAHPDLDRAYLERELTTLGIADFAKKMGTLACQVFTDPEAPLTEEQQTQLHFYLHSGTYGTVEQSVRNRMETLGTGWKYYWKRLFPDLAFYKVYYPFCYRHKLLIPAAWLHRLLRGITFRRKKVLMELKVLHRQDKQKRA